MSWNGPDYTQENPWLSPSEWLDLTKAPWASGIMTLTHEEVLFVIEALPPIEAEYLPDLNQVIARYNQLTKYEKAINGDTYACIKGYDPTVNTLGINEQGVVQAEEITEEGTEVIESEENVSIDAEVIEEAPTEGEV